MFHLNSFISVGMLERRDVGIQRMRRRDDCFRHHFLPVSRLTSLCLCVCVQRIIISRVLHRVRKTGSALIDAVQNASFDWEQLHVYLQSAN